MIETRRKAILTDMDVIRRANKADSLDIYTVQSDVKSTLYLWDGEHIGLYYHGGVLQLNVDDGLAISNELKEFIDDVKDLKRMKIKFCGMSSLGRREKKCPITEG